MTDNKNNIEQPIAPVFGLKTEDVVPEQMAKIPGLKPRKMYDARSVPPPLSNCPRYRATSAAVWKQITDFVRAIVSKTTSLPKPIIHTYVEDALSKAMAAQHAIAACFAAKEEITKQLRSLKKAKVLLVEALANIKTLHHAGFFNAKTASVILAYGITGVESISKMIEARNKILNNPENTSNE